MQEKYRPDVINKKFLHIDLHRSLLITPEALQVMLNPYYSGKLI